MALSDVKKNYTLGRGKLNFGQFKPGTTMPRGERYLGNSPELSFSASQETLDHYSSDGGIKTKDASVILQQDYAGTFSLDDINMANVAMFFLGEASVLTIAARTVTGEIIGGVEKGFGYQLGTSDTQPTGARGVTNVVASKIASPNVALVLGQDYVFDGVLGRLTILEGSTRLIDGNDITVNYSVSATTRDQVVSKGKAIEGALRYISANPAGGNIDYFMPWVKITPNGDFNLKGDDWQVTPYTLEILKLGDLEAIYADGRPYTPDSGSTPEPAPSPTSVSASPTSLSGNPGGTGKITATVAPAGASQAVSYQSSNTAVVTVDAQGNYAFVGAGNASITVSTPNNKTVSVAVAVTAVVVQPTGLSIDPMTFDIAPGASQTLTPTVTPPNATDKTVTWEFDAAVFDRAGNTFTRKAGTDGANSQITGKTVNNKTATSVATLIAQPSELAFMRLGALKGLGVNTPVFDYTNNARGITPARAASIQSAGFNAARTWIELGPDILVAEATFNSRLAGWIANWKNLIRDFTTANKAGRVFVSQGGSSNDQIAICNNPTTAALYIERLKAITTAMKANFTEGQIALELINEPIGKGTVPTIYTEFFPRWEKTIHDIWPQLTVVIQPAGGYAAGGEIMNFAPSQFSNGNVMFAFHPYTDGEFTHQGTGGLQQYYANIPYPLVRADGSYRYGDVGMTKAQSRSKMIADTTDRINASSMTSAEKSAWITKSTSWITSGCYEYWQDWEIWNWIPAFLAKGFSASQLMVGETGIVGKIINPTNGSMVALTDEATRANWLRHEMEQMDQYNLAGFFLHQMYGDFPVWNATDFGNVSDTPIPEIIKAVMTRDALPEGPQLGATVTVPLRVATTRNNVNYNTVAQSGTVLKSFMTLPVDIAGDMSEIVYSVNNFLKLRAQSAQAGSQAPGNAITYDKVAMEYNGVSKPLYFTGNSRSKTLTNGQAREDMLPIKASEFGVSVFAKGTTPVIKVDMSLSAAGAMPISARFLPGTTNAKAGTYDPAATTLSDIDTVGARTVTTGAAVTNQNRWNTGIVLGKPVSADYFAVMYIGDSITEGQDDDFQPAPFGPGYAARTMQRFTNVPGFLNMASFGWRTGQSLPDARVSAYFNVVDFGGIMLGANDMSVTNQTDPSVLFPQLKSVYDAMKNGGLKKVWVHRITPWTQSTDSWATAANQSYANSHEPGGRADQYNNLISSAGFDLVLTNEQIRDSGDRNKWLTNGTAQYMTKDGLHTQYSHNNLIAGVYYPLISALIGKA